MQARHVTQPCWLIKLQVALAWVLSKPFVTSPILGIGKLEHLEDAIAGMKLKLTPEEIKYLEEAYIPREVIPM